jgi:hypothetical protein
MYHLALAMTWPLFEVSRDMQYNPRFQLMSFGILALYAVLTLDVIIEWNLDREERKAVRK